MTLMSNDCPRALRVAFAAGPSGVVDQHFGSARSFLLVSFDAASHEELETQRFEQERQDGQEAKLVNKIAALSKMRADLLVCAQVGPSAVKQLLEAGIQPIAVQEAPSVSQVLQHLQRELREGKATWTQRIQRNGAQSDARFDGWLDEEWDEQA